MLKGAVIGFAQVGSESGWRSANTDSIKASAEKYDVDLQFTSAEGDQAKQISSIKTFITQGVDLIAFSPVVETGWDAVLQEAKAAGIPVVLTDRSVDSDPEPVQDVHRLRLHRRGREGRDLGTRRSSPTPTR